jgi:hypothetical protein
VSPHDCRGIKGDIRKGSGSPDVAVRGVGQRRLFAVPVHLRVGFIKDIDRILVLLPSFVNFNLALIAPTLAGISFRRAAL